MEQTETATQEYGRPRRNNLPLLVTAWLIVGAPAAWGVTQTFKQSLKLFTTPQAATTQPVAR